ncbi:MAG: sulfite exporter TauE/SafE family protein, partial [Gemmatimonadetes bacterium]|nr:sulfite exporter TauE/SafE family protein [Gemmatimonadota bacterium]
LGACVPDDILTPLMLAGAGFIAGTINSIAGGGSLLTLPLLIFIGLPSTVANATNRIAILVGGIGATASFHKRELIPWKWVKFGLPPALIGVLLGTWGAMTIGDVAFERILAAILIAAAAWMIWNPTAPLAGENPLEPDPTHRWLLGLAFFGLGLYSGFIQAGVGFLFLALLAANGLDLVRANAVKVPLILAFTVLAVIIFTYNGMMDWRAGLMLAAGQFFGAKFGVRLQVLKGQEWVRRVLTVTIVIFAIRLIAGG